MTLANPELEFRYGWINVRAAMAHIDVHSKTSFYSLIRNHKLPFGRAGRSYRFRRVDLDQWMTVRGVEALRAVQKAS